MANPASIILVRHSPLALFIALMLRMAGPCAAQEKLPEDRLLFNDPRSVLDEESKQVRTGLLTGIADLESRDVRDAPAHVQVITSRQIEASGARDLMEVLSLVPGLSVGLDHDDVFHIGVHGMAAGEGRCLFMLNGTPLNENDYGGYAIGQRIPLENVERIEVVLGPVSLIHGGYASLGVINIVTRTTDNSSGARAMIRTGYSGKGTTRTTMGVNGAHRLSRHQDISYLISQVRGSRSNATTVDPEGRTISLEDSTGVQSSSFQFNYRWRSFKAYVAYMEETADVVGADRQTLMQDLMFGIAHQARLTPALTLTTGLGHDDQLPRYYVNTADAHLLASNSANQRTHASVMLSGTVNSWFSARLGVSGSHQLTNYRSGSPEAVFEMNGERSIAMNDAALFAEVNARGRLGLLAAGYRVGANDLAGPYSASRLVYTKSLGILHGKLSWGTSYRLPTVMDLAHGPVDGTLPVEMATTVEGEVGLEMFRSLTLTVNAYRSSIADPIVSVIDSTMERRYRTQPSAGTQGVDLLIDVQREKWSLLCGLGVNEPLPGIDVPAATLPDSLGHAYLGLPAIRALASISWDASSWVTLRVRGTWRGPAWSSLALDTTMTPNPPGYRQWPEELILNTGIAIRPKGSRRLVIDLGCNNLLDQERRLLGTTSDPLHPFQLNGREWTVALSYKFVL